MRKEKEANKKNSIIEDKSEFDFCKICKINHNQGRRHNFFPRHINSLSSLLSRFQSKLSGVKFSLKNPSFSLPSQESSDNGIWCIFCDSDIVQFGSTFASSNAIKHFASEDHLKNLKHFLWKYGGGLDKVDSFRITEAEFAKWDKKCKALKSEPTSSSERYFGPSHGQSSDIQPNYEIMNSFDNSNKIHFVDSSNPKDVMPLQYDTNENYQVHYLDISGVGKVGYSPSLLTGTSPTPWDSSQHGANNGNSAYLCHTSQCSVLSNGGNLFAEGISNTKVPNNQSFTSREHTTEGYQNLTQISYGKWEDVKGNVHSGAPPPWLEGFEVHGNHGLSREHIVNSPQKNTRKSRKLNPKRVGAAWAERRKLEMEMEKRGEIITRDTDADWLPNFGRVWQSGTRKESMKEFKKEKLKPTAESQAESEMQLHPYISKRMRQNTDEVVYEGAQKGVDSPKILEN